MKDIIQRLRPRTVPPGHVYHTWSPGMYIRVLSITCIIFVVGSCCNHVM